MHDNIYSIYEYMEEMRDQTLFLDEFINDPKITIGEYGKMFRQIITDIVKRSYNSYMSYIKEDNARPIAYASSLGDNSPTIIPKGIFDLAIVETISETTVARTNGAPYISQSLYYLFEKMSSCKYIDISHTKIIIGKEKSSITNIKVRDMLRTIFSYDEVFNNLKLFMGDYVGDTKFQTILGKSLYIMSTTELLRGQNNIELVLSDWLSDNEENKKS